MFLNTLEVYDPVKNEWLMEVIPADHSSLVKKDSPDAELSSNKINCIGKELLISNKHIIHSIEENLGQEEEEANGDSPVSLNGENGNLN